MEVSHTPPVMLGQFLMLLPLARMRTPGVVGLCVGIPWIMSVSRDLVDMDPLRLVFPHATFD